MSSCLRALQRSWDEEEIEFQKQIPSLSMSLDCCLLGNVVAGFTGGTEARDWFTCDNNGTVGTPKIKHIKIILSQFFCQKINRPNTGGHCPVLHHDQDPTTACVLRCITLQSDPPLYSPDRHLSHSLESCVASPG